jgi:hypothetical protein
VLENEDVQMNAEITRFRVFADMGDTEAAGNITTLEARIALNAEFRAEADAKIVAVEESQAQANLAFDIASFLALGNADAVEEVITRAGPAI